MAYSGWAFRYERPSAVGIRSNVRPSHPEPARMPLSPPAPREMLHRRAIDIRGWKRADGLYDIEAYLEDTKAYPFENDDRGTILPGEPLHGLFLRLTVNEEM